MWSVMKYLRKNIGGPAHRQTVIPIQVPERSDNKTTHRFRYFQGKCKLLWIFDFIIIFSIEKESACNLCVCRECWFGRPSKLYLKHFGLIKKKMCTATPPKRWNERWNEIKKDWREERKKSQAELTWWKSRQVSGKCELPLKVSACLMKLAARTSSVDESIVSFYGFRFIYKTNSIQLNWTSTQLNCTVRF